LVNLPIVLRLSRTGEGAIMMRLVTVAAIAAASLLAPLARSAPLAPERVPAPLTPWIDWVLHGQETARCPYLDGHDDTRRCVWPARLGLELDDRGGRFQQEWLIHSRAGPSTCALPVRLRWWYRATACRRSSCSPAATW